MLTSFARGIALTPRASAAPSRRRRTSPAGGRPHGGGPSAPITDTLAAVAPAGGKEVTPMDAPDQIQKALDRGGPQAARLLPLVYDELRRLAASRLAHEPAGQTLQPTALVHEAYLRLV